jgi:hypothetical protein
MDFITEMIKFFNQIYQDKVIFFTFLLLIISIISLIVLTIAIPPEVMRENFKKWKQYIYKILRKIPDSDNAPLYLYTSSEKEPNFITILNPLIADGATIRLFSYSSETLVDYINREDLRTKDLKIQILIRDWNEECREEMEYNKSLKDLRSNKRKWKKAHEIYKQGKGRKDTTGEKAKIDIRYYKGYPKFKGIIIESQDHIKYAFLGLYHWVETPEGGSQYIGDKGSVVFLRNNRGILEKNLLDRFDSQFERMWKGSENFDEVTSGGTPNPPKKDCKEN